MSANTTVATVTDTADALAALDGMAAMVAAANTATGQVDTASKTRKRPTNSGKPRLRWTDDNGQDSDIARVKVDGKWVRYGRRNKLASGKYTASVYVDGKPVRVDDRTDHTRVTAYQAVVNHYHRPAAS
jgi:hypothetical protein